jgi:hypothetical protein
MRAILVLLVVLPSLFAAPVPLKAKKAPLPAVAPQPVDVIGDFVIEWSGGKGTCTFAPQGAFTCTGWGGKWAGYYTLNARVLFVDETMLDANGLPTQTNVKWHVDLDPCMRKGTLREFSPTNFALPPLRPGVAQ